MSSSPSSSFSGFDLASRAASIGRYAPVSGGGAAPTETWDPAFCGEIDMRIGRDGTWFYQGSPIGRAGLVRLFASVLRRDADGCHYLVTPIEKMRIRVDDAPFVAVGLTAHGEGEAMSLTFETNVGDRVTAGSDRPLRFVFDAATQEPSPYVRVRGRLEALISRSTFYELVGLGDTRRCDGEDWFGVWSSGVFFPMAKAAELSV